MFRAIATENFPPFADQQFKFPPVNGKPADIAETHVLTGVNGTGKTRLLSVLAAMLGEPAHLIRRLRGYDKSSNFYVTSAAMHDANYRAWGALFWAQGQQCGWNTDTEVSRWASTVHAYATNGAAYIEESPVTIFSETSAPDRRACLALNKTAANSKFLTQAIANLKIQSAMMSSQRAAQERSLRAAKIVESIERAVCEITKRSFAFHVEVHPKPVLSVAWDKDFLSFDHLPDGLRSIIGWLAYAVVLMDSRLDGKLLPMESEAVLLLDEIESHLHPAWQRKVLPAFQRLFPKAQIFVATHSPFVIASMNHGWIHRLEMGEDGLVRTKEPVAASAGDSYLTVLEDIMGIHEWYDPETEGLLAEFRQKRDAAYRGDAEARSAAEELAQRISKRSLELEYVMGRELSQMHRQLAKTA